MFYFIVMRDGNRQVMMSSPYKNFIQAFHECQSLVKGNQHLVGYLYERNHNTSVLITEVV